MSSNSRERVLLWVLVFGGVLIPAAVFLFLGTWAAGSITSQNQAQVVTVQTGFLTVDGLLLALNPRFREAFGSRDRDHRLANRVEAFQIAILTISLMWSLVAMLYAAFSTDMSLVSSWFKASLTAFFLAVSIYSSFAILSRITRTV